MAKDGFGNYQPGLQDAGETLPSLNAVGSGGIFSESDFPVVGGTPQGSPTVSTAILIGNDGTQYQWFDGQWH